MKRIVTILFAAVMLLFSSLAYASAPTTGLVSATSSADMEIDAEVLLDSIVATPVITHHMSDCWDDDFGYTSKSHWIRDISRLIISVCAILAFPAFVIIIITVLLRNKRRMLLDKYQVIENAMRSGYNLPEVFYLSKSPRYDDYRRLRSALLWMACGISMMAFGGIMDVEPVVAVGVLPLLIGVAKLIVYVIARRDNNSKQTGSDYNADQN